MAGDPFLSDPHKKRKRPTRNIQHNNRTKKIRPSSKVQQGNRNRNKSNRDDKEAGGESVTDGESEDDDEEEHDGDVSVDGRDNEGADDNEDGLDSEEEFAGESAADKRRRLAKQYLDNIQTELQDEIEDFDAADLDRDIISSRLQKDAAEQKGYVYKHIADRLLLKECVSKTSRIGSKGLTSLSIHYPYCYTTSKDMELSKWDISSFDAKPRRVKYAKGGARFVEIDKENSKNGHMDEIYSVAASPNGKFVVTGGRDRRLIIWSTENLSVLRVLENKTKKGAIYGLAFRRNTDQLYAACGDLKIRTYSINQMARLETLYGHQDLVVDISALAQERCVTVGSRDRTAMLWKIAEETRLTFRGGDSDEKKKKKRNKVVEGGNGNDANNEEDDEADKFYHEGSIETVSMIDDSHFVTGSDNGNLSLWSTAKKKPQFTERLAHGIIPSLTSLQSSGEKDASVAERQVSRPNPYWITSVYAIPFSDIFFSGSWNGDIKVWKLSQDLRRFEQIGELPNAKGVVTKIEAFEEDPLNSKGRIRVIATLSKEPRLGRWVSLKGNGVRNALYSAVIDQQILS